MVRHLACRGSHHCRPSTSPIPPIPLPPGPTHRPTHSRAACRAAPPNCAALTSARACTATRPRPWPTHSAPRCVWPTCWRTRRQPAAPSHLPLGTGRSAPRTDDTDAAGNPLSPHQLVALPAVSTPTPPHNVIQLRVTHMRCPLPRRTLNSHTSPPAPRGSPLPRTRTCTQIAQVALQAKRGGSGSRGSSGHHGHGHGASSLLPSFMEPWEDLAVASLDLSALANRQERLAFGAEVSFRISAMSTATARIKSYIIAATFAPFSRRERVVC